MPRSSPKIQVTHSDKKLSSRIINRGRVFWFMFIVLLVSAFGIAWYKVSDTPKRAVQTSVVYAEPQQELFLPVLMYHHVGITPGGADSIRVDLTVSPTDFEKQVKLIKSLGFESVSLNQLDLYERGQAALPDKPIAFSFDDGYSDVFEYAVPILKKYGYTGSFAIITRKVGEPDYATWEQLKQAKGAGMDFVSHTQTHFDGTNPKFDSEYIKNELVGSRQDLKDNLGVDSNVIIYPYGHYTKEYVKIARELGYTLGFTTAFGNLVNRDTLLTTPRVRVHGHQSMEKLREFITSKK